MTAAEIADNLHQMGGGYFDHDLTDETKLSGSFDFKLEWTAPVALVAKGADGSSILDAVDKQLGLKLELKDVPLPALVIESVNRKPTANEPRVEKELAVEPAKFEVASIKPATPDNQMTGLRYEGGSTMRAGGLAQSDLDVAVQERAPRASFSAEGAGMPVQLPPPITTADCLQSHCGCPP